MNNYYLKLNQVMLKLFNNNLLLETFNPVFLFQFTYLQISTVIYKLWIFLI